jgi:predicted Zn-dependent protease with MMP-like domain
VSDRIEPVRMSMAKFCAVARKTLAELPAPIAARLDNVLIDVERRPSPRVLRELGIDPDDDPPLGLFVGTSLPERDFGDDSPNRILLFKESIEAVCRTPEEVEYEIRRTILHELAHHFGYSEADLDEFENRPSPFDDEPDS